MRLSYADEFVSLQRETQTPRVGLRRFERKRDIRRFVSFGLQEHRSRRGEVLEPLERDAAVDDQLHLVRARRHPGIEPLFRRDGQPHVGGELDRDRPVRFDMYFTPVGAQRLDERRRRSLRERFTAGQDDHRAIAAEVANLFDDLPCGREEFQRTGTSVFCRTAQAVGVSHKTSLVRPARWGAKRSQIHWTSNSLVGLSRKSLSERWSRVSITCARTTAAISSKSTTIPAAGPSDCSGPS